MESLLDSVFEEATRCKNVQLVVAPCVASPQEAGPALRAKVLQSGRERPKHAVRLNECEDTVGHGLSK
jgi:hypothetical protein